MAKIFVRLVTVGLRRLYKTVQPCTRVCTCANVKEFFTLRGKEFFTFDGKVIFMCCGKEDLIQDGKEFFM